jgi:CRISPR/Cas system CSM-associated protein Csm3 (group 7 of RAMP superfamily)
MHNSHRYVARATIEFKTPFIVASVKKGDVADSSFVTDINGLPAIPGTSIAGAIKDAFKSPDNEETIKSIFGYQEGNEGQGSRLTVSWACIHGSDNKPVEGIYKDVEKDAVLADALAPDIRDHVRIGHKGVAEKHGKFDEQPVSAGHRFTFEMEMKGDGGEKDNSEWEGLLKTLCSGDLKLGGKTRRGFGAFEVKSLKTKTKPFYLKNDFKAYSEHPVSLRVDCGLDEELDIYKGKKAACSEVVKITLIPDGYWMFGGGDDAKGTADSAPVRASRIKWVKTGEGKEVKETGEIRSINEREFLIPGSSLKGALSHRTAFYYNALIGNFADEIDNPEDVTGVNNEAVKELFGFVKEKVKNGGKKAQKGKVMIDDVYYESKEAKDQVVHHVSIDRFSGGAMAGMLFDERPLWKGRLEVNIAVEMLTDVKDVRIKTAFRKAIEDLCEGRLQTGAGSGRGEGYFTGVDGWKNELNKVLGGE